MSIDPDFAFAEVDDLDHAVPSASAPWGTDPEDGPPVEFSAVPGRGTDPAQSVAGNAAAGSAPPATPGTGGAQTLPVPGDATGATGATGDSVTGGAELELSNAGPVVSMQTLGDIAARLADSLRKRRDSGLPDGTDLSTVGGYARYVIACGGAEPGSHPAKLAARIVYHFLWGGPWVLAGKGIETLGHSLVKGGQGIRWTAAREVSGIIFFFIVLIAFILFLTH